jgi:hypothetical protein
MRTQCLGSLETKDELVLINKNVRFLGGNTMGFSLRRHLRVGGERSHVKSSDLRGDVLEDRNQLCSWVLGTENPGPRAYWTLSKQKQKTKGRSG